MMMNRFLLGGWAARPSAFYFCVVAGFLSYSVRSVFRCRLVALGRTWSHLVTLPVPSIPSISASLGSYFTKHALHNYALFIHLSA